MDDNIVAGFLIVLVITAIGAYWILTHDEESRALLLDFFNRSNVTEDTNTTINNTYPGEGNNTINNTYPGEGNNTINNTYPGEGNNTINNTYPGEGNDFIQPINLTPINETTE